MVFILSSLCDFVSFGSVLVAGTGMEMLLRVFVCGFPCGLFNHVSL